MPLVVVYGLPAGLDAQLRQPLRNAVVIGVSGVKVLKIHPSNIYPHFVIDELESARTINLLVVVSGLFVRSERTPAIKQELTENIRQEIRYVVKLHQELTKKSFHIEVWTQPLDAEADGYSTD